jgi:hypothetical protein
MVIAQIDSPASNASAAMWQPMVTGELALPAWLAGLQLAVAAFDRDQCHLDIRVMKRWHECPDDGGA